MALPRHIGDLLDCEVITIRETGAFPLSTASEQVQNVIGVGLKAYATNTGEVMIGNQSQQGWPLAAGEGCAIDVSRRNLIWLRGTPGDKVAVLIVRTTGEIQCGGIGS